MSLAVRLLGGVEVPAPPADLADLVVAGSCGERVVGLELGARVDSLALGFVPLAAQPEDLRAVHATGSGEATGLLDVAPAVGGLRPLPGTVEVAHSLGARDRHAVDERRGERI